MAPLLKSLLAQGRHSFWTNDMRLTESALIDPSRLVRREDVTDTHLLALAVARGGRLATFDRKLRTDPVTGGAKALFQIPA